ELPKNIESFVPQRPQTGCLVAAARSSTRFFAPHLGQVTIAIRFLVAWASRPSFPAFYAPPGIVNRAKNTCVVWSFVRLLDHIRYFPSGENTGRPSNPSVNVIRIFRDPSARIR